MWSGFAAGFISGWAVWYGSRETTLLDATAGTPFATRAGLLAGEFHRIK